MNDRSTREDRRMSLLERSIAFSLDNRLVMSLLLIILLGWGALVAPFDWNTFGLPTDPIPVDAIPDIGENQQLVFTEWPGRSPQDVEDQITYPLTAALLGVPGVRSIRSYSFFGFSSIYVIFNEDIEFYWSRSRVLEKLNSLPRRTLPEDVSPALGPDATALGQVFWYTLEGRDEQGEPIGGWDLHELRSIQDWTVRYALQSVEGVSEVASIGGFVQEYQIDVNPDAMRAYGVSLTSVFSSVRMSNVDVGARTIEINRAEYVIRGLGQIRSIEDIENIVIAQTGRVPVRIRDVATVALGPALRRGALDKGGTEAVGGVVVVRYGENPLAAIKRLKLRIEEISPGLPRKVLSDGRTSQVTIVPFYDRTKLIHETLGTLESALYDEILVTIIVVILLLMHLRSALLISALLPITILIVFIAMKLFGVDANVVALSGIAIAIGTIVDMGVVICENILRHMGLAGPDASRREIIFKATSEVGGAVLTAVATTVVSFLPVFAMEAAEGKLFKPLAYTKTFALVASVIVSLAFIPPFALMLFGKTKFPKVPGWSKAASLAVVAAIALTFQFWLTGIALGLVAAYVFAVPRISPSIKDQVANAAKFAVVIVVAAFLSAHWMPLGLGAGNILNFGFVALLLGSVLAGFWLLLKMYEPILRWLLVHKIWFIGSTLAIVLFGMSTWLGMGKEFMPNLDEGTFLYMPSTMPHASMGEALEILQIQDRAFSAIPEVESVVGKLGRADSPLDPAPISMIETVINYKSEFIQDKSGRPRSFRYTAGEFDRDESGELIPAEGGRPFRQWRDHIRSPDDIWQEIVSAGKILGTTSAPKLQPISTRLVMLQTGMRAPMGIKVKGPDLATIEKTGVEIERLLKQVPSINPATVFADRIVGKPYLEIILDREAIGRYGIYVQQVQDVIEVAVGGKPLTTVIKGRERYTVRVRYQRELRNSIEGLGKILIPTPDGATIPLIELAEIRFVRGPMVIKAEDSFLLGYVVFDKMPGFAEVDVVEAAQEYLSSKIESGELIIPNGVNYRFTGSYENQIRSERKLMIVLPLSLLIIFIIIYFQFKKVSVTLLVFSGIFVAWAGGFIMLWLYGQDWFLNISPFGVNLRDLFGIRAFNLSVAVWVGFLALFGIASDDGVLFCTYLESVFKKDKPESVLQIREATVKAALRRIRPALMTSATTILALLPVLTSTGRGSDIMIPMAIPSFGGMTMVLTTVFLVPVLYCAMAERKLKRGVKSQRIL